MTSNKYRDAHERLSKANSWRDGMTIQEQELTLTAFEICALLSDSELSELVEAGEKATKPDKKWNVPFFQEAIANLSFMRKSDCLLDAQFITKAANSRELFKKIKEMIDGM